MSEINRSSRLKKSTISLFGVKGLSVLVSFLFVPVMLGILTVDEYGIWLTLVSMISWFSLFDVGLGNGLRNKLSESIAKDNLDVAKVYVSTAYFFVSLIVLFLLLVFYSTLFFVDVKSLLNAETISLGDLRWVLQIMVVTFLVKFILQLIQPILFAFLKPALSEFVIALGSLLGFLGVLILRELGLATFLSAVFVVSVAPVVVFLVTSIILYAKEFKSIRPSISHINMSKSKGMMGLGFRFFFIQIAAIVLFSTDNFIISYLLGPGEVVPYNLAYKYFGLGIVLFSIITTPLWSSFSDAFARDDFAWIQKTIKQTIFKWLLLVLGLGVLLVLSDTIYKYWFGTEEVQIPFKLSVFMAVFVILNTGSMIFTTFVNGVGKVKMQMYTAAISMTINIPLSIFFVKYMDMGVVGVILATCVSLAYSFIFKAIQYKKIIGGTAKGIWNK